MIFLLMFMVLICWSVVSFGVVGAWYVGVVGRGLLDDVVAGYVGVVGRGLLGDVLAGCVGVVGRGLLDDVVAGYVAVVGRGVLDAVGAGYVDVDGRAVLDVFGTGYVDVRGALSVVADEVDWNFFALVLALFSLLFLTVAANVDVVDVLGYSWLNFARASLYILFSSTIILTISFSSRYLVHFRSFARCG